jgi:hypothetical protein
MRKTRIFLAVLMLTSGLAEAQITITPQVPPVGVLVKTQLWNMLLVNSSSRSQLIEINLVLVDEKTNQPVLTAITLPILLNKGARQIQAKDLGAINYTYNGPAALIDHDPNGMLPAGTYQACYSIVNGVKGVMLAETCIQVAVDPLSPPLLNTPHDEDSIYTAYPQFTWLPPAPVSVFSDLSYDLVLVEVLPGQGKADAIEENIPVYSGGFMTNPYLNYSSSYRSLDTARTYAWRIVALNNGLPTAMSEIWTFKIVVPPKPTVKTSFTPYVTLKRGLGPSVASVHQSLRFNYENIPADTAVHYTIASLNDRGNPIIQQGQLMLSRGENLLEVPLSKTAGFAEKKIYLFQFTNSRNETWSVKFTGTAQ